jgi:CheY-like chemotaxis protein
VVIFPAQLRSTKGANNCFLTGEKKDFMSGHKILLVDDDKTIRCNLQEQLELHGFDVVAASGVNDALQRMIAESFDVLLTDLHMPGDADGLTVVSAMRNAHPKAVTLVYSGYPEMEDAKNAILLQADQILLKPMNLQDLARVICENLAIGCKPTRRVTESIAALIENHSAQIIQLWLSRVQDNEELMKLPLSPVERTGHLPLLLRDLVGRLRGSPKIDTIHPDSTAAHDHGRLRRRQGYTAPLMVEEGRMLQVSIFQTLQNNLNRVDFSLLLVDVMTIADEIDSQLSQAMATLTEKTMVHAA